MRPRNITVAVSEQLHARYAALGLAQRRQVLQQVRAALMQALAQALPDDALPDGERMAGCEGEGRGSLGAEAGQNPTPVASPLAAVELPPGW
ncbi:hypothetical protein [Thiomonas sp.]|uniref:hypothetical protein n=1 Tax=Thiomonas sp. TaxID=2047785 RepID=UPI002639BAF9|nr:hypothetical protein [Thiomonas sp.]